MRYTHFESRGFGGEVGVVTAPYSYECGRIFKERRPEFNVLGSATNGSTSVDKRLSQP